MQAKPVAGITLTRVHENVAQQVCDVLAVEEPLEIRIEYGPANERLSHNVSVTMRTPGNDAELAAGFLFTEGIIKSAAEIKNIGFDAPCAESKQNTILVSLANGVLPNLLNTERNFYTTSSCGVCGKGSVNAIRTVSAGMLNNDDTVVEAGILYTLHDSLHRQQEVFAGTGGLHASALFTTEGKLLLLREDVGRHNALDKLTGALLLNNELPLRNSMLLLSGRASFELVQKAVMAGIPIIAAVGAPSSLAVQLAEEFNITLIGFLRGRRFNIYTAAHRITLNNYETAH